MANALYDAGRNAFAEGAILWLASGGSTVKAALIASTYTPNLSTDANWSDISANQVGSSVALTLSNPVAGVCNAGNITFSAVTGSQVKYVVLYKDTGTNKIFKL